MIIQRKELFLTEAILNIYPSNSEFWQYQGILLNNKFEFADAYFAFEKSLALNPNDIETLIKQSNC